MTVPVTRVYGTADQFSLEFTHGSGNEWTVSVPLDTVDGIYACEITAVDANGGEDMWTGLLFVHNGHAQLEFVGAGRSILYFSEGLKTQFNADGTELKFVPYGAHGGATAQ